MYRRPFRKWQKSRTSSAHSTSTNVWGQKRQSYAQGTNLWGQKKAIIRRRNIMNALERKTVFKGQNGFWNGCGQSYLIFSSLRVHLHIVTKMPSSKLHRRLIEFFVVMHEFFEDISLSLCFFFQIKIKINLISFRRRFIDISSKNSCMTTKNSMKCRVKLRRQHFQCYV